MAPPQHAENKRVVSPSILAKVKLVTSHSCDWLCAEIMKLYLVLSWDSVAVICKRKEASEICEGYSSIKVE